MGAAVSAKELGAAVSLGRPRELGHPLGAGSWDYRPAARSWNPILDRSWEVWYNINKRWRIISTLQQPKGAGPINFFYLKILFLLAAAIQFVALPPQKVQYVHLLTQENPYQASLFLSNHLKYNNIVHVFHQFFAFLF